MSAVRQVFGSGFQHQVAVVVPGTNRVNQPLPPSEHAHWVRTALRTFSVLFGGATAVAAQGGWVTHQGDLVEEAVTIVYSFTSDLSIHHLRTVSQFAQVLGDALGQESVAVVVDGELFFVE